MSSKNRIISKWEEKKVVGWGEVSQNDKKKEKSSGVKRKEKNVKKIAKLKCTREKEIGCKNESF